jgi:hypothetical protein
MSRPRSTAFLVSLLAAVVLASDSPPGTFCPCGVQVGGTVAASDHGTIFIDFGGTPQPGKFSGTSIAARIWGRTVFLPYLSRNNLPGRGVPVVVTLDAKRNDDGSYRLTRDSDGSYRINEIWANVR